MLLQCFLASNVIAQESIVSNGFRGKLSSLVTAADKINRNRHARPTRVRLSLPGRGLTKLELAPVSLFSKAYSATAQGRNGIRRLIRPKIKTFNAKIHGRDFGRFTISEDNRSIDGLIRMGKKYFLVTPLSLKRQKLGLQSLSTKNSYETVLVEEVQEQIHELLGCTSTVPTIASLESESDEASDPDLPDISTLAVTKLLEISTDADSDYVSAVGSSSAANSRIVSIINWTDGIYQHDLGIHITIRSQHTWEGSDPFDRSGDIVQLLTSFGNYWSSTLDPSKTNDHVHLYTAKSTPGSGPAIGVAWVGGACLLNYRYGLSGNYGPDLSWWGPLTAHEIGHNIGGQHISDNVSIMNPYLVVGTDYFASSSVTEIQNMVNGASCISNYTPGTPTPTPTATSTNVPGITPSAAPTSSNTATPSPTATATPTRTATSTPTRTPTVEPTSTIVVTPLPTATEDPSAAPPPSNTEIPTATPTEEPDDGESSEIVPPSSVTASDGRSSWGISVGWSAVSNAKYYLIYRSKRLGKVGTKIAKVSSGRKLVLKDYVSGTYFYGVKAVSTEGAVSVLSQQVRGRTFSGFIRRRR